MEKWADIKGYEGIYQVSNLGRVATFRKKDGFVGFKLTSERTVMATIDHGNGYRYVTLVKDGRNKNHYVHRLVAEAFIDDIPEGYVINHKDYDRSNNCVDNLEITTQLLNTRYSQWKLKKPKPKGDNHYIRYKDCRYEVTVNRKYLGRFMTLQEARSARDEYIKEINYY